MVPANIMKPRSKRNRKRPREDDDGLVQYETTVIPYPVSVEDERNHHDEATQQQQQQEQHGTSSHPYIRTIQPYPYTYATFAKGRWLGRTLLDVYSTEYGSYPSSYYVRFDRVESSCFRRLFFLRGI